VQNVPEKFRLQLLGLGASRRQMIWVVLREARLPMLAAIMAGFGGIISEIGASLMVGGNIKGQTRTLTTAMVLETNKGSFDVAIALAILLLVLVFLVNWALTSVQQRRAFCSAIRRRARDPVAPEAPERLGSAHETVRGRPGR
jgi:tungstate transport system permease protein